jgi:putative NIF3 family GTP cyclohydrolase 1 type 2
MTDNPERPAWLPVDYDEAIEMIAAAKGGGAKGRRKVTIDHVFDALKTGDMQRQALIQWLMRVCDCSDQPARKAIDLAALSGNISTYTEPNPRGGKPLRWFALKREESQ